MRRKELITICLAMGFLVACGNNKVDSNTNVTDQVTPSAAIVTEVATNGDATGQISSTPTSINTPTSTNTPIATNTPTEAEEPTITSTPTVTNTPEPTKPSEEEIKKAQLDEAKRALDKAQSNYDSANSDLIKATAVLEKAKEDSLAKSGQLDSANKTYLSAKSDYESVSSVASKGSVGFFESVGNSNAVSLLKNATYASYTKFGESGDATSLKNMADSIKWMKECNSLRKKHGLGELKVSDELMAIAQSDANYSANIIGHSGQYNVGENLAWGYSNPFDGWYTAEKKEYDAGNVGAAGHYLNIIEPGYVVTGFAINTNAKYGTEHGQVFGYDWDQYSTKTYTVDEYEKRFNNFYNSISSKQSAYETAYNNKKSAESAAESAKAKVSEAEKALNKANNNLATAKDELIKAQNNYDKLK